MSSQKTADSVFGIIVGGISLFGLVMLVLETQAFLNGKTEAMPFTIKFFGIILSLLFLSAILSMCFVSIKKNLAEQEAQTQSIPRLRELVQHTQKALQFMNKDMTTGKIQQSLFAENCTALATELYQYKDNRNNLEDPR